MGLLFDLMAEEGKDAQRDAEDKTTQESSRHLQQPFIQLVIWKYQPTKLQKKNSLCNPLE